MCEILGKMLPPTLWTPTAVYASAETTLDPRILLLRILFIGV